SNTTLNGLPLEESALEPGDRLCLGPVELVVLDPEATTSPSPAREPIQVENQVVSEIHVSRDLARKRSRQLLERLRRERLAQRCLQNQICDLQEELLQAVEDGNSANRQLESKSLELAAVKQELAEQKEKRSYDDVLVSRSGDLEQEVVQLTDRVERLSCNLSTVTDERQKLVDDNIEMHEQHRRLVDENSRLHDDVVRLTLQVNQKAALAEERDELRGRVDQLSAEARSLAAERRAISDERSALCRERNELREHNDELRARFDELSDQRVAEAREKLSITEQRDALSHENDRLQARITKLAEENEALAASKAALAEEQSRLRDQLDRLADLERDMQAAVAGRQNTSEELHRALLQIAELKERVDQNSTLVEVYEGLSKERDELVQEMNRLRDQIKVQQEERAAIEAAWKCLSDEATASSEARERLADENSKLLANLEDVKQQLEQVRHEHAALVSSAAGLDNTLAAKTQAEIEAAAGVAIIEKKLAEQAREFAESTQEFEEQLAAACDLQASLEQSRDEWRRHCAEAEDRCAAQSSRIADLEAQLAAIGDAEAKSPDHHELMPLGASWHDESHETCDHSVAVEPERVGLGTPIGDPAGWRPEDGAADIERLCIVSGQNENGSRTANVAEDGHSRSNTSSAADWSHIGTNDSAAGVTTQDEDASTEVTEPAAMSSVNTAARQTSETEATKRAVPTSFIERYAHLFSDDEPSNNGPTKPEALPDRLTESSQPNEAAPIRSDHAETLNKNDDEESVEQYMAKLLQRMRGAASEKTATVAQLLGGDAKTAAPVGGDLFTPSQQGAASPDDGDESAATPSGTHETESPEPLQRKSAPLVTATELGALRALANETARRAISRHDVRKQRRETTTKAFITTLASGTGLWLMFISPNWRSIQFITACATLLVAACWAGQTCRALWESRRVARHGIPDSDWEALLPDDQAELPIDVEERG
ncbi:MAG TPA: hypothetical protein VHE81_04810, partial [Lacipirellulaceae bacterium]|nr:hypothetical protein [Lacipirellulaceae bacterium]